MKKSIIAVICCLTCFLMCSCGNNSNTDFRTVPSGSDYEEDNNQNETKAMTSDEALERAKECLKVQLWSRKEFKTYKYLEFGTKRTEKENNAWRVTLKGNFMGFDEYGSPVDTYNFTLVVTVPGKPGFKWTVHQFDVNTKY